MTREVYDAFGFDRVEVTLQTRPEKFLGRIELWDAAEAALERAVERRGLRRRRSCRARAPSTARRSTSTSATCSSARGRSRPCRSTARCRSASGSRYVTPRGQRGDAGHDPPRRAGLARALHRDPARAHRRRASRSGSRRCRCACCRSARRSRPTRDGSSDACRAAGLRAEADLRNEKLSFKIREAQLQKIPGDGGGRRARGGGRDGRAPPSAAREQDADRRSTRSSRRRSRPRPGDARRCPIAQDRGQGPDQQADPRPRGPRDRRRRRPARRDDARATRSASPSRRSSTWSRSRRTAIPPVCRIMDYGKFRYAEKKKAQEVAEEERRQPAEGSEARVADQRARRRLQGRPHPRFPRARGIA